MGKSIAAMVVCQVVGLVLCSAQEPKSLTTFPGAEGIGGRGGKAIKVTNLKSSGPGSLDVACQAKGSRIVVFEVSGVICGDVVITQPPRDSDNDDISGDRESGKGLNPKDPERLTTDNGEVILRGRGPLEAAPHGKGNVYAPSVLLEEGQYRMWYSGQGADGHDRILYAISRDGTNWKRQGIAVDRGKANHVNDPSVLKVDGTYFMYYSKAETDVLDVIDLATSKDGVHWELRGTVVRPGKPGAWDALLAGRPSVLHHDGKFKMWFDGRKDLPINSPAPSAPKSTDSHRFVGFATSADGFTWTKHPRNPVFGHDAGAVDVHRFRDRFVMLYESGAGVCVALSQDGMSWEDLGVRIPSSKSEFDRSGHVTPHLLIQGDVCEVYYGASSVPRWDRNVIAVRRYSESGFAEGVAAAKPHEGNKGSNRAP